jgi:cytochrome c-type biogenesis protein CcmE
VARSNPARLVIALAIASCLAVFLLYTSLFGGGTLSLQPSELVGHRGEVSLSGRVATKAQQDSAGTARFRLRDIKGSGAVTVVYRDGLPDQFKVGRDISVDGRLRDGVFVGKPGTMVTKCPSKYTDKKTT